jgi:germination protein M
MNRCPHTRVTPALPMWAALCLLAALLAAGVGACGRSGGSSPAPVATVTLTASPTTSAGATTAPTATPSARTRLSLYYLAGETLGVAERRVPLTTKPATAAMTALLAGPTAAEQTAGLTSAVPGGTRLLGLSIDGTTAKVDLSAEFSSGGGSLSLQARVAQVVYTLTQFKTVDSVKFLLEGSAVDALGGEGLMLGEGQTRADWRDFEPPIFVESPGVGAALTSPFTLSGTASVFEGSFTARLVDDAGGSIVRTQVQASAGAPERGRFRTTISFGTAAQSGTLIVYSQSMEDGSRQNEVRIPVEFVQD